MRLTIREKDGEMCRRLLRISDDSFSGIERPPVETFEAHFLEDEVFVDNSLTPGAFAIVTQRGGPYIWSIAVRPDLRGAGVGKALLTEVTEYYRTVHQAVTISLTCKVDNVAAQVLYLKHGFRPVRVLPRYYAAEGDGVMMRLYPNLGGNDDKY
jgi:ribosomal-protein-alanine N-acetyltransferase